jgi:two-component system chemotaxis response regulator CheB
VLVVVHGSPWGPGNLAPILERMSHVPVSVAVNGLPLQRGVFVAPPDRHVVVADGKMLVTHGPKENGFRPAIDPLFRTAALAYGSRVIGVVLSGALDDGAYGLNEIKAKGGLAIVQDLDDAEISAMPRNAIAHVDVDYILPAAAIAPLLRREIETPPEGDVAMGGRVLPRCRSRSRRRRARLKNTRTRFAMC